MIDDALSNGTKYVDGWSGERISWLENEFEFEFENKRTAVLLKMVRMKLIQYINKCQKN